MYVTLLCWTIEKSITAMEESGKWNNFEFHASIMRMIDNSDTSKSKHFKLIAEWKQ